MNAVASSHLVKHQDEDIIDLTWLKLYIVAVNFKIAYELKAITMIILQWDQCLHNPLPVVTFRNQLLWIKSNYVKERIFIKS